MLKNSGKSGTPIFRRFRYNSPPVNWTPILNVKKMALMHMCIAFKIHARVLNKIFSQCLRACLIFHSYTSGNPIVSYKREGDSTDGWTSSTSLGSSTAGDTFDWGSATSFTESREYAINVQLDPGVFVYFMSYIKRQLKKKLQDTRSWN